MGAAKPRTAVSVAVVVVAVVVVGASVNFCSRELARRLFDGYSNNINGDIADSEC